MTSAGRPASGKGREEPLDLTVSVSDFGPIVEGTVDLRPLTVFVGPSHAGKTYLAVLVYALYRVLGGTPRFPALYHPVVEEYNRSVESDLGTRLELRKFFVNLGEERRNLTYFELPEKFRNVWEASGAAPRQLAEDLLSELHRCFDLDRDDDLIRHSSESDAVTVEFKISKGVDLRWRFSAEFGRTKQSGSIQVANVEVVPDIYERSGMLSMAGLVDVRNWLRRNPDSELTEAESSLPPNMMYHAVRQLLTLSERYRTVRCNTYFLPAARTGIIQSHRAITSALVGFATRGGEQGVGNLPLLSGIIADFLQELIGMGGRASGNERMQLLAAEIEDTVLAGRVSVQSLAGAGFPIFTYRPTGADIEMRLNRTSSMVSELAPLVLLLRGGMTAGDVLIIEEPEAHLHPAAQDQMASVLTKIVRAGIRVLVTTHSDWMVQQIGNEIRAGKLAAEYGGSGDATVPANGLLAEEVGVWCFNKGSSGSTIKEIEFNPTDGVEPQEYYDVGERIYNRSARLQNELEDARAERNHE